MRLISSLLLQLAWWFSLVESECNQITGIILYFHFVLFSGVQCTVWGSGEWVTCSRSSRFGAGLKPWSSAEEEQEVALSVCKSWNIYSPPTVFYTLSVLKSC